MTLENTSTSNKPHRTLPAHLQVPWGIPSALIVYFSAWLALEFVIIIALMVLAPVWPLAKSAFDALMAGSVQASFALDFVNALGALALVWFFLHRHQVGWEKVGWRKFNFAKMLLYILAIFLVFVFVSNAVLFIVSVLLPSFNPNQAQTNGYIGASAKHPSIALIALVVLPPIIEETVFRGFIFPAFAKKFGLIWGAVISSLLFGLAHLQANVGIYTFILGLLLCFMYVKLKSIVPGILFHALNNYLALLALTSN